MHGCCRTGIHALVNTLFLQGMRGFHLHWDVLRSALRRVGRANEVYRSKCGFDYRAGIVRMPAGLPEAGSCLDVSRKLISVPAALAALTFLSARATVETRLRWIPLPRKRYSRRANRRFPNVRNGDPYGPLKYFARRRLAKGIPKAGQTLRRNL